MSQNTRYDNGIPGMAAACHWGAESGKLMYSSTSGYVPTCVYMSHRPSVSFPSSRENSTCPWYSVGRKMSDKNLQQRINIKSGKSASETVALLTVSYGEYAMKKLSVFEWHRWLKEGQDDVQDYPRSVSSITRG
jgi:hypothetical protein